MRASNPPRLTASLRERLTKLLGMCGSERGRSVRRVWSGVSAGRLI